jgi:glycosyltransferase involved in cell wall biosynthesis
MVQTPPAETRFGALKALETLDILIFNWRCWLNPEAGGAEVFTKENAERWAAAGHRIALFTSQYPGGRRTERINDVNIIRAGGKYSVYREARKHYREYLYKKKYAVVIDEINTVPFFTPEFVKESKIVALIHQLAREFWLYETPFPISRIGYSFLEKRWLKKYTGVHTLTVSESTRQDLLDLGFQRVSIIPEGLNFRPLRKIGEKEANPTIVYSGRLKRAKRPDLLLQAFQIVRKNLPTAKLWVIGDGYLRKRLENMPVEGVSFFGNLSNEKRRKLIERAWILVNPSVREGFGLNIVEANALGTPCIAYDVPGLRDSIRDRETGILVEGESVEELASAIIDTLNDSEKRARLGSNALRYARGFSWDKSAEVTLRTLASL